ncbi:MAG: hypothetical protein ACPMAQ_16260 [Phycisphaerae bacterium]
MDTRVIRSQIHRPACPRRYRPAAIALLAALLGQGAARAQPGAGADAVERSVSFVEKSTEATELLSRNKLQEALAAFQELAAQYPDLDEDGYVAMAIGDCLASLGRDAEARDAYRAAAAAHPALTPTVNQRITDLELAGEVSDAMIERLRAAAASADKGRYSAAWQLGRALQRRAKALLIEAAAAFRTASEADTFISRQDPGLTQARALEALAADLGGLIDRLEDAWGSARRAMRLPDKGRAAGATTGKGTAEWVLRTKDGRRIEFQIMWTAEPCDSRTQVTANGKPLKLTDNQQSALKRHEDEIRAILLQAAEQTGEAGR